MPANRNILGSLFQYLSTKFTARTTLVRLSASSGSVPLSQALARYENSSPTGSILTGETVAANAKWLGGAVLSRLSRRPTESSSSGEGVQLQLVFLSLVFVLES
jgi:hypothetical protein